MMRKTMNWAAETYASSAQILNFGDRNAAAWALSQIAAEAAAPLTSPTGARSFHALDNVSQRLPAQIDAEALQRHVVQLAADRFEAFLAYKAHEAAPQCQKLR